MLREIRIKITMQFSVFASEKMHWTIIFFSLVPATELFYLEIKNSYKNT